MRGKKHEFSEIDKKYIVDNWGKESPYSMRKKFNCSWEAVCSVAKENNLDIPIRTDIWTKEDIETLIILAEDMHYEDIADIMGRTTNAIYLKARRLGITLIQDRREWTKEEEDYLKEFWGLKSIEFIAKKLKRTINSLKVKAVRMKLGPMIMNNFDVISITGISELLGVTRDRITNRWYKLGLKIKNKRLTNKKVYYVVKWENLMAFLEENQNEWDSRKLEYYMLGIEPEWLKEKRKRDLKENPLWYRRWTEEDILEVELLFKKNKNYQEIAEVVERSEWAVANILRNMGYSYRLPMFWKGSEFKYLRENFQNLTHAEMAQELGRTTKAVSAKCEELGYLKRVRVREDNKKS